MKKNLLQVSKVDNLLVKKSTLYKWHHIGRFPELFVKFSGILCLDLDAYENLIESGRAKKS